MKYYNTTALKGTELKAKRRKAESQTDRVYKIFKMVKDASPTLIFTIMNEKYDRLLITSVRRSISDLTKQGKLVKTDKRMMGGYGSKEFVWKLATS